MAGDDNDNVEYQLSDDDETIYEPEEEQPHAGGSPEKGKPKKPSSKRRFLAIIVIIIVIFVGYRFIRSIGSKKEVSQVSPVSTTSKTTAKALTTTVKPVSEQTQAITKQTSSAIKHMTQLQQKNISVMEDLKQQQSNTQVSLEGFHQRMSGVDDRIDNLQDLTKGVALQVKQVQQVQQKQEQASKTVLDRQRRLKAARISRLRRKKSYFVQAVIPGRAWLRGADGSAITIVRGDKIPGYGQVVSIDPYSGTVAMSSGIKLRYGIGR